MPPQQSSNDYNFIMQHSESAQKRSLLPGGGGQRIAIIIIGAVVVLGILTIVLSSFFGGGGVSKDTFLKISQQQTELARVAEIGSKDKAASQATKNVSTNVMLATTSQQKQLAKDLAKYDISFDEKELLAGKQASVDKELDAARSAANFDSVIVSALKEDVAAYRANLALAYKETGPESIKARLQKQYKSAELLEKQLEAAKP